MNPPFCGNCGARRHPKRRACSSCGAGPVHPCAFVLGDHFCGYRGDATECNKSARRCQELGNFVRFGGMQAVGWSGHPVDALKELCADIGEPLDPEYEAELRAITDAPSGSSDPEAR